MAVAPIPFLPPKIVYEGLFYTLSLESYRNLAQMFEGLQQNPCVNLENISIARANNYQPINHSPSFPVDATTPPTELAEKIATYVQKHWQVLQQAPNNSLISSLCLVCETPAPYPLLWYFPCLWERA